MVTDNLTANEKTIDVGCGNSTKGFEGHVTPMKAKK